MSHLLVIAPEMHKIAEFPIKVKYRRPGNVIEYISVEFEIFIHHEYFKALPLQSLQTRLITNLPVEILFQVKNGQICYCKPDTKEVVENIVSKLAEMNIVEIPQKDLRKQCIRAAIK